MSSRVNRAAVWASTLVVFLLVAVESHPPSFHDDEATAATASPGVAVVRPPSQADDRQLRRMMVWTETARSRRGRRRPVSSLPLPSSASVHLVGVDVRRVQRRPGVSGGGDDNDDEADDKNSTNYASDDYDAAIDDELRRARIRCEVH